MLKTTDRIITLTDLQRKAGTVVENAEIEPIAVTSRGKPVAFVVGVQWFDAVARQLEALDHIEVRQAVALSEEQFARGDFVTLEEIEAEFAADGVTAESQ